MFIHSVISPFSLRAVGTNGNHSIVDAWINKLTGAAPSQLLIDRLNAYFTELDGVGGWQYADLHHLFTRLETDEQRLTPFISTSNNIFTHNGVTFGVDGVKGNGSSIYLDTNWNASVDGVNFVKDSATIATYIKNPSSGVYVALGTYDLTLPRHNFIIPDLAGSVLFAVNSIQANVSIAAPGTGYFLAKRTSSSNIDGYHNGGSIGSGSVASEVVIDVNTYVCAVNQKGVGPVLHSPDYISTILQGGDIDPAKWNTAYNNYLLAA